MEEAQQSKTVPGWVQIGVALFKKSQTQPYRGIEPRGIGKRAWARSMGYDNVAHMTRVMAERARAFQQAAV